MENLKATSSPERIPRLTHYGYRRTNVSDWKELLPGDILRLDSNMSDVVQTSGTVDAVSEDGSFLWLIQDNGAGRKLFHHVDGYTTLMNPRIPQVLWQPAGAPA